MPTKRVNITIDADLHERARTVLRRLPAGATFSSLVEDAVAELVPSLEEMADALEEHGHEGVLRVVEARVGRSVLGLGTHARGEETE